jgi:CheY-like chemotaxis protein
METMKRSVAELRQFLRAVANDQLLGDEIANALLLQVDIEEIQKLPPPKQKTALFSRALARWRQIYEAPDHPVAFTPSAVLLSVSPVDNLHHQASILVDIMDFESVTAAKILGIDEKSIRELLSKAQKERVNPVHGKALIIEDEALIADEISDIASKTGVEILGPVATRPDAVALASNNPPDLILADFDLGPGGSGLDAVKDITSKHNSIAVFITGFPEEVLTGEDFEPAFVINKPFDTNAITAAIFYALARPRLNLMAEH